MKRVESDPVGTVQPQPTGCFERRIAQATSCFSTSGEHLSCQNLKKTSTAMAKTKARGFASGKRSRKGQAKAAQRAAEMGADRSSDDPAIGEDEDDPPLAQPARKTSRGEPTRKSHRGKPMSKRKPPLQGPPAAQSKRTPIELLDPDAQKLCRRMNRVYGDRYREKKRRALRAEAAIHAHDAAAYSHTKTGKKRKDSEGARRAAKARNKKKIEDALDTLGPEAIQSQTLKDVSEGKRK